MDVEDLKPSHIQEDEMCSSDKSKIVQTSEDSMRNEDTKVVEEISIEDMKTETAKDLQTFTSVIETEAEDSGAVSFQSKSLPAEVSVTELGQNKIPPNDNINPMKGDDQVSRIQNSSRILLNASREAFEKSLQAEFFERSLQAQDFTEDDSRIPKRKSGSLSEMVLATLPLKKQKSEDSSSMNDVLVYMNGTPDQHFATDTSERTDHSDSLDSHYALASPLTVECEEEISKYPDSLTPVQHTPPADVLNWLGTFSGWDRSKKLFALEQLLDSCESQQVRHVAKFVEPKLKRDFISLLPKELALVVLGFLQPRDLLRAAQTCQYWRIIAEDNLLWREKCEEAGLSNYLSSASQEALRRRNNINTSFIYSTWKAGFLKQYRTEMNLRQNPIKDPKVLKGHDDHVITCLEFFGNKIVSGSDDNTLKVWCAVTGKCLRTLSGHTGGVWTSQMDAHFIISGSTDRCLKVWDVATGTCLHTLRGHTSTVRCMKLHQGIVVSGSRDATLRMWDVREGECLHVLAGHMAAVRCVQYDGRLVISGGYDFMVKVWDPEREECLHTLVGHTNRVYSLQFDGIRTVVSGSLDTSIMVWDVVTGVCRHTLMGHQSLTSGLELQGDVLVSGNADSTVKIWNILSGNCLQTLAGPHKHGSAVTSIQFNDKFVVTSSDDGTVKLWDVKTGEFIRDLVALESGGAGGVVWRIRMNGAKIVCAVGSRNGTEETKLLVLNFDTEDAE